MYNDLRAVKGVVVDAGHGGEDPGAVNGNIYEKDFNLAVSEYIYNRLKELGIPTYLTRSTDETLDRDERVDRILSAFGDDPNVIVLSNHINSGGGDNPSGKLTFFEIKIKGLSMLLCPFQIH